MTAIVVTLVIGFGIGGGGWFAWVATQIDTLEG
jgi:hypothetical protein